MWSFRDVWAHGGASGRGLAEKSHSTGSRKKTTSLMSPDQEDSIETKLTKIVTKSMVVKASA